MLDADADAALARLARLTASLTGAAAGVLWLVEDGRVLVRSRQDEHGAASGRPSTDDAVGRALCEAVLAVGDAVFTEDAGDPGRPVAGGIRAWAGLPVHDASGVVIGVLGALDVDPRRWSPHEREVLTTLAQAVTGEVALRTALADAEAGRLAATRHAADSERLAQLAEAHAAEVEEYAATLRESLLPARLPDFPGVEVAARFRAGTGGSVLGDFYDLIPTPAGWGAVVGDVCGKGPRAARTTALARSTVRAVGHTDEDAGAVLSALHGVLHVWFDQRPSFATAVYASMRPRGEDDGLEVDVASAGHPPAVLQRRDGTVSALSAGGRALGIRPEARVAVEPVILGLGDRLLLFTDGVTEARPAGGGEFEVEGLLAAVRASDPAGDASATADAVLAAVDVHADGAVLDDTVLVVIRAVHRGGATASGT
nr:GAF domain-containing SpoIIE family protein phosphatase [Actinomycetospora corticicola]